jgi:hypothetical protein
MHSKIFTQKQQIPEEFCADIPKCVRRAQALWNKILWSCSIACVALRSFLWFCRKFNNCSVRDILFWCALSGKVECRFTPVPHCAKISLNTVLHDTLKALLWNQSARFDGNQFEFNPVERFWAAFSPFPRAALILIMVGALRRRTTPHAHCLGEQCAWYTVTSNRHLHRSNIYANLFSSAEPILRGRANIFKKVSLRVATGE